MVVKSTVGRDDLDCQIRSAGHSLSGELAGITGNRVRLNHRGPVILSVFGKLDVKRCPIHLAGGATLYLVDLFIANCMPRSSAR